MPKYFSFKVAGYFLYYTSHCIIECMHVHASDKKLTESRSAKFFVKEDGTTVLKRKGRLKDREIAEIQKFIKMHYLEMYDTWKEESDNGFYESEK